MPHLVLLVAAQVTAMLGSDAPPRPPADSVHLLQVAERAQESFERFRRERAPRRDDSDFGVCERTTGRICYWDDETALVLRIGEPIATRDARDSLISVLTAAAQQVPGDAWVVGERVMYLAEAGRHGDAVDAATECRGAAWWCAALTGYAYHTSGLEVEAAAAFDTALREMPEAIRCRWRDISWLLDDHTSGRYRHTACAERGAIEERFWWLADPMYSVPANERRNEHYSRLVISRLQERGFSPWGIPWGDDLRELTVRYGWPVRWMRSRSHHLMSDPLAGVAGLQPEPSYQFEPSRQAMDDPLAARTEDWNLRPADARARYADLHARSILSMQPEMALFLRGDTALVVALYDVSEDSVLGAAHLEAALILARNEHDTPVLDTVHGAPAAGALVARVSWEPTLASVELRADDGSRAARTRFAVHPPGTTGVTVSDLLFYDPVGKTPTSLGEALPRAMPVHRREPGTKLGLYWETYGLGSQGDSAQVEVSVKKLGGGLFKALFGGKGKTPTSLRWIERAQPHDDMAPRGVTLDLAGLSPGHYRIEVRVSHAGSADATTARELEIRARDPDDRQLSRGEPR